MNLFRTVVGAGRDPESLVPAIILDSGLRRNDGLCINPSFAEFAIRLTEKLTRVCPSCRGCIVSLFSGWFINRQKRLNK